MKKKELTEDEEQIVDTVVDKMKNDDSQELIKLMQECNISNAIIMLTMFGIGTHTEYYKVLYNRINNNRDKVNDDWLKKQAVEIFEKIDRNEEA